MEGCPESTHLAADSRRSPHKPVLFYMVLKFLWVSFFYASVILAQSLPHRHLHWTISKNDTGEPITAASPFRFAKAYGAHMVLAAAPKKAVVWGYALSSGRNGGKSIVNVTLEKQHDANNSTMLLFQATVNPVDRTWKVYVTC